MKKITIILFALLFASGMSALSFAKAGQALSTKKAEVKSETFKGKIIAIDTVKNEIAVKNNVGVERTIVVDPKIISSLKVDEEVKITLKAGSNIAERVKKIVKPVTPIKGSGK